MYTRYNLFKNLKYNICHDCIVYANVALKDTMEMRIKANTPTNIITSLTIFNHLATNAAVMNIFNILAILKLNGQVESNKSSITKSRFKVRVGCLI